LADFFPISIYKGLKCILSFLYLSRVAVTTTIPKPGISVWLLVALQSVLAVQLSRGYQDTNLKAPV